MEGIFQLILNTENQQEEESSSEEEEENQQETNRESKSDAVERFTYLGTVFTRRPELGEEIQSGLAAENRCLCALNNLIGSKLITRKLKARPYETVIIPVVLYGSEVGMCNKIRKLDQR